MKKRALFFDCFYSFTFVLSPLSLSRLYILNKKLYKNLSIIKVKEYLEVSALNGQLSSLLFFIRSKYDFNIALTYTSKSGYIELCKHLIKLGANNFNWALKEAALGSHLEVCKYFIKLGANNFKWALANAALGGYIDLCNFFINLGANDFNLSLAYAACGSHIHLCKYFIKLGASDFNWALAYAKDEKTKEFLKNELKQ